MGPKVPKLIKGNRHLKNDLSSILICSNESAMSKVLVYKYHFFYGFGKQKLSVVQWTRARIVAMMGVAQKWFRIREHHVAHRVEQVLLDGVAYLICIIRVDNHRNRFV